MRSKFAASALAALLYAQGLLAFSAIAAVVLKDRAQAAETSAVMLVPAEPR